MSLGFLPVRRARQTQPANNAGPNPRWQKRGMCFLWASRSEVINQIIPTTFTALRTPDRKGVGAKCLLTQVNVEWSRGFCRTSNGSGTGDFTIMAYANPASAAVTNLQHVLSQKNDAAGSPFGQAGLWAHANDAGVFATGRFCFATFSTSNTYAGTASLVTDGEFHLWTGVRRGTTHELWMDNRLLATVTGTVRDIHAPSYATRYTAVGSRGNGATESFPDSVNVAAMFDAALSAAEIAELAADANGPNGLFAPRLHTLYWDDGAAAAGGFFARHYYDRNVARGGA